MRILNKSTGTKPFELVKLRTAKGYSYQIVDVGSLSKKDRKRRVALTHEMKEAFLKAQSLGQNISSFRKTPEGGIQFKGKFSYSSVQLGMGKLNKKQKAEVEKTGMITLPVISIKGVAAVKAKNQNLYPIPGTGYLQYGKETKRRLKHSGGGSASLSAFDWEQARFQKFFAEKDLLKIMHSLDTVIMSHLENYRVPAGYFTQVYENLTPEQRQQLADELFESLDFAYIFENVWYSGVNTAGQAVFLDYIDDAYQIVHEAELTAEGDFVA